MPRAGAGTGVKGGFLSDMFKNKGDSIGFFFSLMWSLMVVFMFITIRKDTDLINSPNKYYIWLIPTLLALLVIMNNVTYYRKVNEIEDKYEGNKLWEDVKYNYANTSIIPLYMMLGIYIITIVNKK